ncbi:MAG: ATP-binding protein [Terrimicrobiaceae bacterium]
MSYHPLLARQLRRAFGSAEEAPPELAPLFGQIDAAYQQFDQDRRLTDRAMELSSVELTGVNARLLDQNRRNEQLLDRLRKTVSLLGTTSGAGSDDLLHLAEEIEHLVARRQATEVALREAKDAADAANRSKSDFLANMSHEIRTPLNAVVGMASVLLDSNIESTQREYIEIIRQNGDALLEIINDILDFSKIEAGQLELEPIPCDLRATADQVFDLFSERALQAGLDLGVSFAPDVPAFVLTDPTRLRQILINLVGNAIKFTTRGSVRLTASFQSNAGDPHIEFAISDTGIGIPPERLGRLFKAFSQVDSSTSRKYGGTGLGLAITLRLVQLLDGKIDVTSEPGTGSTFTFRIPARATVMESPAGHPAGSVDPDFSLHHPLRILVAEDIAVNRKVIGLYLARLGYQSSVVVDGREAVDAISASHFDVVLMDMQMPGIDGLTATRLIRSLPGCARHPYIIALTANVLVEHRADAVESGMQDYLSKPLRAEALTKALRRAHDWLKENPRPVLL